MSWAKIKNQVFFAIEKGNNELAVQLIEDNPDVLSAYNISRESLLHIAARTENIAMMEILVSKGLDVNITKKSDEGKSVTPLHCAAESDSNKSVRWLLSHGANIDAGKGVHATPLIDAVMENNTELVNLFIESGADINASYCIGEGENKELINALKAAVMNGYEEIANILRRNGASEPIAITKEFGVLRRKDELLRHIEESIGPIDRTLTEVVPGSRVSVSIHIILPQVDKNYITLVTSGMSDLPMDNSEESEDFRFAELLIKLPISWPINKSDFEDENIYWPFGWLRKVAHIPHMYEGWLNDGIIIPNGEPPKPLASQTNLSCIMISKPRERHFQKYKLSDGTIINFYTLIPIYQEERKIALEKGCDYLLEKLNAIGVNDIINNVRENIALRG